LIFHHSCQEGRGIEKGSRALCQSQYEAPCPCEAHRGGRIFSFVLQKNKTKNKKKKRLILFLFQLQYQVDEMNVLLERGKVYLLLNEPRLSLVDIDRALKLDPQSVVARHYRALLMLGQKRDLDAAACLMANSMEFGLPRESNDLLFGTFFWRFPFSHFPTIEP